MKTNWPTKKLGDVCEKITDGSHFSPVSTEKGKPYVTVRDISWLGKIDLEHSKRISEESYSELVRNGCKPEKGDLLYSKDGTVGKLALVHNESDFVVLSSLAILTPSKYLDQKYLYYAMQSPEFSDHALHSKTGAAIKRVVLKTIKTFEITLPPLVDQKRIVKVLEEKLGKIKETIQLRNDAIADTEKILSSKLSEIFTEGKEKGWEEHKIIEICEKPQYGFTAPSTPEAVGPKMLRITDIQNNNVNWDKVPYCVCNDVSKYKLVSGDIVFARTGATVGKSFLITESPDNAIYASYLIRLRTKSSHVSPEFLYYFFQSNNYWDQISEQAVGGAQPNVNGTKLANLELLLPDLKTQEKIIKELDELRARVAELRALQNDQLADLKSLERAYLHEAFNGELA